MVFKLKKSENTRSTKKILTVKVAATDICFFGLVFSVSLW